MKARVIVKEEAGKPFDLTQGPLIRVRLISWAGDAHVLVITLHHIVSEGWSLGVLLSELGQVYGALSRGESASLEPLPIQYADYAQWQRQWLQGEVLERQLGYWREQLSGLPPVLMLPTDRARPAQQTYRGSWKLKAPASHRGARRGS